MENCAYGDQPHEAEKYMSGTPICNAHWTWVKLDHPAAAHWAKAAEAFLSNVDMYDMLHFMPAAGLDQAEFSAVLEGAKKILDHSREVLKGIAPVPEPEPNYSHYSVLLDDMPPV